MPKAPDWLVHLWDATATARFCQRSAAVSAVSLALGIVSGGSVRLTGSGLGCLDWPACTSTSVIAPLQFHAWMEFGNRLVNVLITVAIATSVLAAFRRRPRRRDLDLLALGLVGGVLAEVVLGGETVLHKLAPPYVMGHFLLAMVLLADGVVFYHRSRASEVPAGRTGRARVAPAQLLVRPGQLVAARTMLALLTVVVVLGTVVTSTGPHAGAPGVPRFHFSLHTVAQLHGSSVELLLAVTVLTLWSLHRGGAPRPVLRRAEVLLAVLAVQAAVGYSQYLTGDPVLLVGIHLAGATSAVIAMLAFNLGLNAHEPVPSVQTVREERESAPALVV